MLLNDGMDGAGIEDEGAIAVAEGLVKSGSTSLKVCHRVQGRGSEGGDMTI